MAQEIIGPLALGVVSVTEARNDVGEVGRKGLALFQVPCRDVGQRSPDGIGLPSAELAADHRAAAALPDDAEHVARARAHLIR